MDVRTNLEPKIDELIEAVRQNTAAAKVTNALLLGQAVGVKDVTEPLDLARIIRYLQTVSRQVGRDAE